MTCFLNSNAENPDSWMGEYNLIPLLGNWQLEGTNLYVVKLGEIRNTGQWTVRFFCLVQHEKYQGL